MTFVVRGSEWDFLFNLLSIITLRILIVFPFSSLFFKLIWISLLPIQKLFPFLLSFSISFLYNSRTPALAAGQPLHLGLLLPKPNLWSSPAVSEHFRVRQRWNRRLCFKAVRTGTRTQHFPSTSEKAWRKGLFDLKLQKIPYPTSSPTKWSCIILQLAIGFEDSKNAMFQFLLKEYF